MLDTNNLNNTTFEITEQNKAKAVKVYTVADLLEVDNNPLALELSEAKTKLSELANSSIAKSNNKIKNSVNGVYSAISTLDIINKSVSAYRSIKPKVKLAVNIGGLWRNFANIGEIAQDAVQLAFRNIVGEGKKVLEEQLIKLLSTPVMLELGDGTSDTSKIVLDKYREYEANYKELVSDYLLNLSMDDFLELVRLSNDKILRNFAKNNKEYWFSNFYTDKIYDIGYKDGLYYLVFLNRIDSYDANTLAQETIFESENNINGIYFLGEYSYYSMVNGINTDIYKNEVLIGTVSGTFIKFEEFNNTILIITNSGVYHSDSLTSLYSGEVIDFLSVSVGMYVSSKTQIKLFEDLEDLGNIIYTVSSGEITSISYLDGLFFSIKENNLITINKLFNEIEIIEKECNETGFSFVKFVNAKLLAYKNKALYELVESSGSLTAKVLTTNLPGDIADIDYIAISGRGYYITSVGTSLFVADTSRLNSWEEKAIDFESIGSTKGIITSIKVEDSTVYLSSLKKVYRVSDNSKLLPSIPYVEPDILTGVITQISSTPSKDEEPSLIEIVPIVFIKEYDEIIYKILTKDIVSYGSSIKNIDSIIVSKDDNIYSFDMKDGDYYYSQKKNIYINDVMLKSFSTNTIITSIVNYENDILFFTEDSCFTTTDNLTSLLKIDSIFQISENCIMSSDGKSVLAIDKSKVFNINQYNSINEIIQKKEGIIKISTAGDRTFLFTEDEILSVPKSDFISQDSDYHNGYFVFGHYNKGAGIAPFDLRSNILKNVFISKSSYISSINKEFEENFIVLMNRIPDAVLEKIEKDIFPEIYKGEVSSSTEESLILNTLRNNALQLVNGMLSTIMKNKFSIGIEDSDKFVTELNNRLNIKGKVEITDEFYFVANSFIKTILEESIYEMNSLDLWAIVWEYYNRHKYEWADRINTEINKSFIGESTYNFVLNTDAETELKNYLDTLLNTTCKNEIESFVLGKTGSITPEDKIYLRNIISSKPLSSIVDMSSADSWISSITESVDTLYIPSQYHEYINIVDDSNMYPIQWQELPFSINRETFDRLLNIILGLVKDEIKSGIKILVEDGDIACFSCVEPSIIYKEIKRKIDILFQTHKKSCENKVYNSTTYEDVYKNFYILSGSYTKEYLKEVLNGQTKLYSKYINSFVDAIIESSQENYVEVEE